MAILSKLWIAFIHLPDSSKKYDYLTTILVVHVISHFGTGKQGFGSEKLD
jgi:hypothetical protein